MVVKAVEMVRKIREKHYNETKNLSVDEQIKIIKTKSEELQKRAIFNSRISGLNVSESQHQPFEERQKDGFKI